jgi:argininosuccinate lyase
MRLWLRDELRAIEKYLVDLLEVIAERAEQDIEYIMPGYTHLQRAQVSLIRARITGSLLTTF